MSRGTTTWSVNTAAVLSVLAFSALLAGLYLRVSSTDAPEKQTPETRAAVSGEAWSPGSEATIATGNVPPWTAIARDPEEEGARVIFSLGDSAAQTMPGSQLSACESLAESAKTGELLAKRVYYEQCVKRLP